MKRSLLRLILCCLYVGSLEGDMSSSTLSVHCTRQSTPLPPPYYRLHSNCSLLLTYMLCYHVLLLGASKSR